MNAKELIEQEIRIKQSAYDVKMEAINKNVLDAIRFKNTNLAARYMLIIEFWQRVLMANAISKDDFVDRIDILKGRLRHTPLIEADVIEHQAYNDILTLCLQIILIAE